jgi:hypothetical protein
MDELVAVLPAEEKDLDDNLMFRAGVLHLQNTHGINISIAFL